MSVYRGKLVIDGAQHIVGRLASFVAKYLLAGNRVAIVRCEELVKIGKYIRHEDIFRQHLRKRRNTNPKTGPYHFRAPSKMFIKAVRGMLPVRTDRGQKALGRLKAYEGVPAKYQKVKRMVIPKATRILKTKRKFTKLGELATKFGWKYGSVVNRLEEKRKKRSAVYYKRKVQKDSLTKIARAQACVRLSKINLRLKQLGCIA